MAEQEPPRASLQQEVDYWVSKAGNYLHTFSVVSLNGPCVVPKGVHIRFYKCTISSFSAILGYNNFYFKDCVFSGDLELKDASAIFNQCTINSVTSFTRSKVEYLANIVITTPTRVLERSFVKGTNNTFSGGGGPTFIVKENSRVESIKDNYTWSDIIYKMNDYSFVKSSNCNYSPLPQPIVKADNNCSAVISDTKLIETGPTLFDLTKECSVETFNVPLMKVSVLAVKGVKKCRVAFRNVEKIVSDVDAFDFTEKCDLFVLNTKDITVVNILLKNVDEGNFKFSTIKSMKSDNQIFNFDGGSLSTIEVDLVQAVNEVLETTDKDGNVRFVAVKTIKSTASDALNIKKIKLRVKDVELLKAQKVAILGANAASVNLNNVPTIKSDTLQAISLTKDCVLVGTTILDITSPTVEAVLLKNKCNVIFKDVSNIKGQTNGITMNTGCILNGKDIDTIMGSSQNGVSLISGCQLSLSSVKDVKGAGTNGILGSAYSRIILNDVVTVTGSGAAGISLTDTELTVDNSGASGKIVGSSSGIAATCASNGSNSITITGPTEVAGPTAMNMKNYVVTDKGVTYKGNVLFNSGFWHTYFSTISGNFTVKSTIISSLRNEIKGVTSFSDFAVMDSKRSKLGKISSAKDTLLTLQASEAAEVTALTDSALVGSFIALGKVNVQNSFLGMFKATLAGNIVQTGTSSVLGGGLRSQNHTFTSDNTISAPTAIFSTGGKMGLQADDTMFVETDNYKAMSRTLYRIQSEGTIDLDSLESTSIISATTIAIQALESITSVCDVAFLQMLPAEIMIAAPVVAIIEA